MIPLLLLCRTIWRVLVLAFLWISGRILHWNHLDLDFFGWKTFLTASNLLWVIALFKLFICTWFNFGNWYLSRKLSIYLKISNLVEYSASKCDLLILWISPESVVMFLFSFLSLLICTFSVCLLVRLDRGLAILLTFPRPNSLLHWFFVLFSLFKLYWLQISKLPISWHLLLLGMFASFCSRVFWCSVNSLLWLIPVSSCGYIVLWTFLSALFSECPIELGILCLRFH